MLIFATAALLVLLGVVMLLATNGARHREAKNSKTTTSNTASKRQLARSIAYTLIGMGSLIVLGMVALGFLLFGRIF